MAVLSLPLSFTNSFWSQDYRTGVQVLFRKLEQGVAENAEIVAFIRARAVAEGHLAASLVNPGLTGPAGTGFGADDGASLLMAFRGLQAESIAQGQVHKSIANELNTLVAEPFEDWALSYADRIRQNKATVFDSWLKSYDQAQGDVAKLKQQYLAKTRKADEAEDDAKFAPNSGGSIPDTYTTSPRVRPVDGRAPPPRTPSVAERIAKRLKEIRKDSAGTVVHSALMTEEPEAADTILPKVDKGKGKAVDQDMPPSPPPMSPLPPRIELTQSPALPQPILLAGLAFKPASISQLLTRAAEELPLRPIRFPLLGEYQDCFAGEELVSWLNVNVPGFGGSLDRAEDAAKDLAEREGLLRRIGEFGNQFENSDEAFYQFRPKAFDVEGAVKQQEQNGITPAKGSEALIKQTNNFVNLVTKVLNNAKDGEHPYVKARHEADEADNAYRIAIRKLDRQRLGLEERLEETLKILQRWETERLRAVKTVLLQYQGTLANLPKSLDSSFERQATLVASYQPENDLTALIERYRTGPFRPDAQVYESIAHDESDVVFGIDLRKWAEGGWHELTSGEEKKDSVPPVITGLVQGLQEAYKRLPNDTERRKAWIYEVPLATVHHLREALNAVPVGQPIPAELLARYEAPVIASALKLWILELDPPLALYEGYDDLRKLYPTVGSAETQKSTEEHIQNVGAALQRLPRVHLYVLDAVVKHLKTLIENTNVEESDEVYITKLALSVGRSIVRPKVESQLSIQDRHPTLLFIDLLKNYDAIIPPTISRKKRESERKVPVRKRTRLVDMRVSRSRLSVGADAKQLLAAQQIAQNPSLIRSPPKTPELPPLPPPIALTPPPPPPVTNIPVSSAHTVHSPPPPSQFVPPPPPPATVIPPPPPPSIVPPPPPPPVQVASPPPPPPVAVSSPTDRPAFKEPPPEVDGQPPRPAFKEPPPEPDDSSPSRPTFVEPPASPPPPTPSVTPPTPFKRTGASSPAAASPSPTKVGSRSPSPPEDQVLGMGRTGLSRAGSGPAASVRGPRATRVHKAVGSVADKVKSFNTKGSPSPPGTAPTTPISASARAANRLSGSPVRRPSSVLGRNPALSRRTMASDAEDDVLERK